MPPSARVTRSAHGRHRALRSRAPGWVGRSALVVGAVLALASGTAAAALVDVVTGPVGGVTASVTDAAPMQDVRSAGVVQGDGGADAPTVRGVVGDSAAGSAPGVTPDREPIADVLPQVPAPVQPAPPVELAAPVEPALPDGMTPADAAAGLLSLATPAAAGGELVVVPGSEPAPLPDRRVRTVRVEVEAGLEVDGALFARTVMDALNDPRGWVAEGEVSFARTDGDAELRVVLASPQKVDEMCAPLRTESLYSCGAYGHAALNHMRWVQGTEEFTDLTQYRQYLVNHEVGHLLGRRHVGCPGAGQVAPIMQQQTIQVAPCVPNGWPYPDAS
ncbi:DUF3152 domain-containing protein [Actinotalea sp. Marseille-Q4924]|uniref:DUF3152 domain-containing protein n=1 Tax=Actinotalea sp. Marseille-Q4924 TaxID=2866571 RepID=UPI001CE3DF9B|nr:DUF3152 domain-containing protein [Actinotalea sp. Marseille-Q4924]